MLYKYRVGPRLGRQVNILRDNDKRERFVNGITSIHFLEKFSEKMREIGYKNYSVNEFGLVCFELGSVFSESEIKEMLEQSRREHELFHDTIKPAVSFPEIYSHFLQLARILPKKIQKMEPTQRELFGRALGLDLNRMGQVYYGVANGRMNKDEAQYEFLCLVDDMLGTLVIIDEAGLMPEAGLLRLGTIIADLRSAVNKMYEKKPNRIEKDIGVKATP